MFEAIALAKEAYAKAEIPVGAVVVKNGEIIGKGRNMREEKNDPTSHAEIEALRAAAEFLGSWRLDDCSLYVTLEPCAMCAGAIINARIKELVFGAYDTFAGCADSAENLFSKEFSSKTAVFGGIAEQECSDLLKSFFEKLRKQHSF